MPISKPVVIATEGATIDGRNISRDALVQMAANYDPKVYTAMANLEHYLSMLPDSVFSAYGKVVSLSTQEAIILGEKKMQLLAVVDVNDAVVEMQKTGKKLFSSMEMVPNFINKGVAYLTGLAFTDSPASLGTEALKFSAQQGKESLYSFGDEVELEFEAITPNVEPSLFARVADLLKFKGKNDDKRFADVGEAVTAIALSQKDLLEKFTSPATSDTKLTELSAQLSKLQADYDKVLAEFAALNKTVEAYANTPNSQVQRPAALGGNGGSIATDC